MVNGRDDNVEIPYTVGDRVLAEHTATEVTSVHSELKNLALKFDEYLQSHASTHKSLGETVAAVQNNQKVTNKVLRFFTLTITLVGVIVGISKSFGWF